VNDVLVGRHRALLTEEQQEYLEIALLELNTPLVAQAGQD